MNIVLILIFVIGALGCHPRREGDGSFISPEQTTTINGFFVMLVFLRHFRQYITLGKYDGFFDMFDSQIGQLIVVTFLFYSGYGIMYSLINKENYLRTIPIRFLKLLLHFDLAILLFLIADHVIGKHYPISTVLPALIGWITVGNSTWYIFVTLCLYIMVYVAGIICKKRYGLLVMMVSAGCILYVFVLHAVGKGEHWFNTILCFPAGMLFAIYYGRVRQLINKRSFAICSILISLVICLLCHKLPGHVNSGFIRLFLYETKSVAFAWIILSVSVIFVIGNPVLAWLGGYVFEIYILQRIPMMLLQNVAMNKYLYFVICLACTLII